jgi:hypothetical protein
VADECLNTGATERNQVQNCEASSLRVTAASIGQAFEVRQGSVEWLLNRFGRLRIQRQSRKNCAKRFGRKCNRKRSKMQLDDAGRSTVLVSNDAAVDSLLEYQS